MSDSLSWSDDMAYRHLELVEQLLEETLVWFWPYQQPWALRT